MIPVDKSTDYSKIKFQTEIKKILHISQGNFSAISYIINITAINPC